MTQMPLAPFRAALAIVAWLADQMDADSRSALARHPEAVLAILTEAREALAVLDSPAIEPGASADMLGILLDASKTERRAILSSHPGAAGIVLNLARAELDAAEARETGGDAR